MNSRQNGKVIGTLSGHSSWVLSVSFSPDNIHFASSSSDRTVKIWDKEKMKCVHTFYEHQDQVTFCYQKIFNKLLQIYIYKFYGEIRYGELDTIKRQLI